VINSNTMYLFRPVDFSFPFLLSKLCFSKAAGDKKDVSVQ
jgi:hypothetical protein